MGVPSAAAKVRFTTFRSVQPMRHRNQPVRKPQVVPLPERFSSM
jgi:hypothetical protein